MSTLDSDIAAALSYFQRSGGHPPVDVRTVRRAPAQQRRIMRIHSVGRHGPDPPPRPADDARFAPPTAAALGGLHARGISVAFAAVGDGAQTAVHVGTCAFRADASAAELDERAAVVRAALSSAHPGLDADAPAAGPALDLPLAGIALGTPAPTPPSGWDRAAPLDRVIRGLHGQRWAVVVVARPLREEHLQRRRADVLAEVHHVRLATGGDPRASALAELYLKLLDGHLDDLAEGIATGGWQTSVVLLGDQRSYPRLTTLWRAQHSRPKLGTEPVRVVDVAAAAGWAPALAFPDEPGEPAPGALARPFAHQTLLSSAQLAAYIHLPERETAGFAIREVPQFDVMRRAAEGADALDLGAVVENGRPGAARYSVERRSLTRHAFVCGVTGSGKTNTIHHLLGDVQRGSAVPFLVLEPAKAEYRALIDHRGLGGRMLVLTLGDERVAPLRMNPLEVIPPTPVSVHIDLLRALFTASFGMWVPLPQILERALLDVYADRGWDITANSNRRLEEGDRLEDAFPTLAELQRKVEDIIGSLGYDGEVTSNMRAALSTRLTALRLGGRGRMLDVQRSTPPALLFDQPAVLELERIGDDQDKAFLMGLVLIRLVEHRRSQGPTGNLRHLLVIEEAHRLLSRAEGPSMPGEGNPEATAVRAFVDLLAEVRAYGQGVIVADQVPVRLAPEVLKNTNLKVVHRTLAADDRAALAATMTMDEQQSLAMARLSRGQALLFSEGDDGPLLVVIPRAKGDDGAPADRDVRARAAGVGLLDDGACSAVCSRDPVACAAAGRGLEQPPVRAAFARLALHMGLHETGVDAALRDLLQLSVPLTSEDPDEALRAGACLIGRGARWYAARRGAQHGWSYGTTRELESALMAAAVADLDQAGDPARGAYRDIFARRHIRRGDPFHGCGRICSDHPPTCAFRHAAADLILTGSHNGDWADASRRPAPQRRDEQLQVALDAAARLLPMALPPEDAPAEIQESAERAAMCFAQQMIAGEPLRTPPMVRHAIDDLLAAEPQVSTNPEETHAPHSPHP